MNSGYQKYKNTSIQSASREKLLLMLYEGAIRYVKRAIIALEKNDRAERGLNIGRTYDIILELNNTLNHEASREIATNLEQLYMFITDQLTQANIKGERPPLDNVLRILETLYAGWSKAIEQLKKEDAASSPNPINTKP